MEIVDPDIFYKPPKRLFLEDVASWFKNKPKDIVGDLDSYRTFLSKTHPFVIRFIDYPEQLYQICKEAPLDLKVALAHPPYRNLWIEALSSRGYRRGWHIITTGPNKECFIGWVIGYGDGHQGIELGYTIKFEENIEDGGVNTTVYEPNVEKLENNTLKINLINDPPVIASSKWAHTCLDLRTNPQELSEFEKACGTVVADLAYINAKLDFRVKIIPKRTLKEQKQVEKSKKPVFQKMPYWIHLTGEEIKYIRDGVASEKAINEGKKRN